MQENSELRDDQVEVTRSQLKYLIKEKFKSIRRFCDITGQPNKYASMRFLLMDQSTTYTHGQAREIERNYKLAMSHTDNVLEDEISLSDRKWIKEAVETLYGSLAGFCRDFDKIPRSTIRDLIIGRTKRKNDAFKEVCQHLMEELQRKGHI